MARHHPGASADLPGAGAECGVLGATSGLGRALIFSAIAILVAAAPFMIITPRPNLGWHINLILLQDRSAAVIYASILVVTALALRFPFSAQRPVTVHCWSTIALSLAVFTFTAGGAVWVLGGYAFTHDEFLLVEEARTFLSGSLAAPIPEEWRPFIGALQPYDVRLSADGSLLSTGYYPGSAAIYALFEAFGAGPLAAPAMAAGSVLLTASIAQRLFPGAPAIALAAAGLLAVSPQFLVTAMTPFAMTAHLFLNLAWLALFLRDDARGHIGAMAIGAMAIAQHQIHIHPLFVLPFLADLALRRRKWGVALAYAAVYVTVFGGCMAWRGFVLGGPAVNPMRGATESGGLEALLMRVTSRALENRSLIEPLLWLGNFLRLVTWQNVVVFPLAAMGLCALGRAPRELVLLVVGAALSLLPYLLFENNQGVGWGFRYLHVELGTLSLLAVWGAQELRRRLGGGEEWGRLRTALLAVAVATAPVFVVWRVWDVAGTILPYRVAEEQLRQINADALLITQNVFVRNDFAFQQHPRLLLFERLSDDELRTLCARFRVAAVTPGQIEVSSPMRLQYSMDPSYESTMWTRMAERTREAGCP